MSIILKEIDLPKGTEGIGITFHTADGWRETHITDVTQAIQIPTPHGRLKDADASLEELRAMKVEGETFITAVEFAKITINDAPTIFDEEK